jgi:excinuclease ABC subunit C
VRNDLRHEMEEFSREQKYELAKKKYEQILMLDYLTTEVTDTRDYLTNPNFIDELRQNETNELKEIINKYKKLTKIKRIECYDIAHLAGTNPTASMVTFIDGEPDKRYYRHFRIRLAKKADDYGGMKEVIRRRKKYFKSWGRPDLILIDGGKGQVSAVEEIIKGEIPVVGIAKRRETLIFKVGDSFESYLLPEGGAKRLVQRLRNEAHRFARRYHHNLVSREIKNAILKEK